MNSTEITPTERDVRSARVDEVPDGYTAVGWPESQKHMEEDWFEDNAILINGGDLYENLGDQAYLIPSGLLNDTPNIDPATLHDDGGIWFEEGEWDQTAQTYENEGYAPVYRDANGNRIAVLPS